MSVRPDPQQQGAYEHEDGWVYTTETISPTDLIRLPRAVRRMLRALDGYWWCYDGYRPSIATEETWWSAFEKYRRQVEAILDAH